MRITAALSQGDSDARLAARGLRLAARGDSAENGAPHCGYRYHCAPLFKGFIVFS